MTELLVVIVTGFVVIAAATLAGPRLGIAAPLVLVAVGVAASFLPVFGSVRIDPAWILEGVLHPLLYSAAVSMPAMNFRREFGAIGGLSVVLVIGTSLLLGVFFALFLPGLGFAWGVALGAIISPTDAVATSIVKQAHVSPRVSAILDGESLLNDATALVLLRTAIVAVAGAFSVLGAVGTFAYSVVVAVVIGLAVGALNLVVRKRVTDATVDTVISFAVPFVASVPAGLLNASGLVAAVVAGLVTGVRGPRDLSPQHRLSDAQNWRTVELLLEGAVFLTMGLQLKAIVTDVEENHAGVGVAVLLATGALLLTVVVRTAYVSLLLLGLRRSSRHAGRLQGRLQGMQQQLGSAEGTQAAFGEVNRRRRQASERDLQRFAFRVTQGLADVDYFLRAPLGWRDGAVVVWAGMRGAVTVAAAQTLPENTPFRPTLVLVAFAVAALSLLLQGGTIGPLLRRLRPAPTSSTSAAEADDERTRLTELMRSTTETVPDTVLPEEAPRAARFAAAKTYRLAVIAAQRSALLDARDHGTFDADVLADVLATLDADQIAIELRGAPVG